MSKTKAPLGVRRVVGAALALWLGLVAGYGQRLDPTKELSQYNLQVFQKEAGLPQSTVHGLYQARSGYLYAATYKGLARYDGIRLKTFDRSNVPEFSINGLLSVLETRDSTLWLGSNGGGLISYRNGRYTVHTTQDGLSNNIVISLYEDQAGTLWIGTRTGLSRYRDGVFTAIDTTSRLGEESVLTILEVSPGELWVGTHSGFFRVVGEKAEELRLPQALAARRDFYSFVRATDGAIWLATSKGLLRYQDGRYREYTTANGLSDNAIRVLYFDRGGVLWVGTLNGGLNRMLGERFTYLDAGKGIADEQVISICEDREGNVWFGTKRGGLYRLSEGKFLSFGTPEGLPDNNINGILEDRTGAIWFGTNNRGLVRYQGGKFTTLDLGTSLGARYVRALHEDPDGSLWVGTYGGGLARLQNGRVVERYTTREGLADDYVRVILGSRDKGLWVATRNGLSYLYQGRFTNYTTADGLGTNSLLSLALDERGGLWIGTDGAGLYYLYQGKFRAYTEAQGLLSGVVMNLYLDPRDKCLWIGTNNGLSRLKDDKFDRFTGRDGTFGSEVFQILEDDEYNLWLGANDGVYKVSKQQLYDFAAKRTDKLTAEHFAEVDGMRSSECTPNCYPNGLVASDGRLWLPTNGGLAVVDTRRLPTNAHPPLFAIDRVVADGQAMNVHQPLTLAPGVGKIEIEFSALTFVATPKAHVEYQLEGFDSDWQPAGTQRLVAYTNLWPGTYTFRVRGANNDGVANPTGAQVVFVIQPKLYQRVWFWLLIGLVLTGGVVGAYRYNLVRLQARNEELEQRVHDRTQEVVARSNELRLRNKTITQLGRVGQELTAKLSPQEVIHLLQRSVAELVPHDYFGLYLYDEAREEVVLDFALEGAVRIPSESFALTSPRSLAALVVREHKTLLIHDFAAEKATLLQGAVPIQRTQTEMQSRIYLPLVVETRVLGCLTVHHHAKHRFSEADVELLQTLAAYAAIALDNARAYQRIREDGAEIARQNFLLEERNAGLARAMDQLKSAQDKLIATEKMAALGGLVANIAHEINTPISAVATTARNSQRFVPALVYELPRLLQQLSEPERKQFYLLVEQALDATPYSTTREEREARRRLKAELLAFLPAVQAEEFALKLVQMGFRGHVEAFQDALSHPERTELLNLATQLVQLGKNNELIIEATARTSKIVSALKAYTRLTEESVRVPIQLHHALDSVLARQFERELQGRVQLEKNYALLPPVMGVTEELDLVWTNLLHNAFQAVSSGGTIRLTIHEHTKANGQGKEACVTLTDTGPGIPEQVLPRIFEPFFTTRSSGEGSGLGLDIARKIIDRHNGRIEVDTASTGTTFRVYLPLS